MYFSIGPKELLRSLVKLSAYKGGLPKSTAELRAKYLEVCQSISPFLQGIPLGTQQMTDDAEVISHLIQAFQCQSLLNDKAQEQSISQVNEEREAFKVDEERVRSILNAALFFPCELRAIFDLAIHSIFISESKVAHGGSTSNALGVIWMRAVKRLSDKDIAELLVHESTHTYMHIDECCHEHYANYRLLETREAYALSAILQEKRPMDKALHSLVVAAELLQYRERVLGQHLQPKLHPPSEKLREQAGAAGQDILDVHRRTRVLTKRGEWIAESAYATLH